MATIPFADYTLLLIGLAILLLVLFGIVLPNTLPIPWARLHRQRRELRHCQYRFRRAAKAAEKAQRIYAKLKRKSDQVKPRKFRLAEANAADLKTMLGHAKERVMVAENHLRKILLEEYAPEKQRRLLKKYLPAPQSGQPVSHPHR